MHAPENELHSAGMTQIEKPYGHVALKLTLSHEHTPSVYDIDCYFGIRIVSDATELVYSYIYVFLNNICLYTTTISCGSGYRQRWWGSSGTRRSYMKTKNVDFSIHRPTGTVFEKFMRSLSG